MRRRGRFFDVVMIVALAAFVVLQVAGPADVGSAAAPSDTSTRVDHPTLQLTPNEPSAS